MSKSDLDKQVEIYNYNAEFSEGNDLLSLDVLNLETGEFILSGYNGDDWINLCQGDYEKIYKRVKQINREYGYDSLD